MSDKVFNSKELTNQAFALHSANKLDEAEREFYNALRYGVTTANNMVITQIAPIYFPGTSLVTAGDDIIEIKVKIDNITKKGNVALEVDGSESIEVKDNDIIRIKRAEHFARTIKVSDKSFYQLLKEKMSKANC